MNTTPHDEYTQHPTDPHDYEETFFHRMTRLSEATVNTPGKLRLRLLMAADLLRDDLRAVFPKSCYIDNDARRMVSTCGGYVLQWENTGLNSVGSCYVVVLRAGRDGTTGI
jgi:hypothetical protein